MTKRYPHLFRMIMAVGVLAGFSGETGSGIQAQTKPEVRSPKPAWTVPRTRSF